MKTDTLDIKRISVIGFGEAGGILGQELAALLAGNNTRFGVATYDLLLDDRAAGAAMRAKAAAARVETRPSLAAAVGDADLAISAVTADQALGVARDAARHMKRGGIFLDINSVAPNTKRAARDAVEAAGADYVEAAVMAAVPPARLKVEMLLGGKRAAALAAFLNSIGMNTAAVSAEIGIASATKMCRSIVIKGIEALAVECLFAARLYGAEDAVLASLDKTFPGMGWTKELPTYLVSRAAEHGRRRAAEMREVAAMLTGAKLEPYLAAATAQRHDWLIDAMNAMGMSYDKKAPFVWKTFVDAITASLSESAETPKKKVRS
jgi:3-hydroxyisobutyrate dehydrogenase-like beta-hydroxyacid dehydrogenase